MASNEQIQQAIQASANAGAASGYAQSLEDVVGNLDLMLSKLAPEDGDEARNQQTTVRVIRSNIVPELERRRAVAERELRFASASQAQLMANSPTWQVSLVRRIIDASRLRPLLVQALGGADYRRPTP